MLIIRKEIIDFLFVKTRKKKEKLLSNIKVARNLFKKKKHLFDEMRFSDFFIFVIFYYILINRKFWNNRR